MFYLIHFCKIVLRFPVRVLSWVFLTITFLVLASDPNLPLDLLTEYKKQEVVGAYFHALIDGEQNHSRLSRNLLELPQVVQVDLLNQEEIIDQVNTALSGIKHELPEGLLALNYNGLKVTFAADVKESSQDLVRDYLTRLGGSQNVTLGPIVRTQNKPSEKNSWSNSLAYILLGAVFMLWGYLMYSFTKLIHRECYLIQEFQRRNFVANKVYTVAIIFVALISLIVLTTIGQVNIQVTAASLLLIAPFMLLRRRYQW